MNLSTASRALGALAQESRLGIFRLLIRAGDEGLAAGVIAHSLALPGSTLSAHLTILAHAGLITAERQGRSIRYRVDLAGTRRLFAFLMEDCCRGRPELCQPALEALLPQDCA